MTKTMVTVAGALLLGLAATVVKSQQIPAASDSYFEPDTDKLKELPANLALVRPTHFQDQSTKIKHVHDGDSLARTVGRNVTFRDLIAEAYDCDPGCVVLPLDAPTGGFDFVVTIAPKTRKHLREAIEQDLGYTATSETRDTQVLVLQVKDPSLPGLTASGEGDDDIDYHDGKLFFTRQPIHLLVKGLEDGFAVPVVDNTGLTNNYNFSLPWNEKATQAMRDGTFTFAGAQKVFNNWGLELKSDTAKMEMFTVKKMH